MFWLNIFLILFLLSLSLTCFSNIFWNNRIQEDFRNKNFNQVRSQIRVLEKGVINLEQRAEIYENRPYVIEVNPRIVVPKENPVKEVNKVKTPLEKLWDIINNSAIQPFGFGIQPSLGI